MNFIDSYYPTLFPTSVSGMFELFDEMNNIFAKSPIKKMFPYPMNVYNKVDKKTNKLQSTIIEVALAGFDKSEISVKAVKGKSLTLTLTPKTDVEDENIEYKDIIRGIAKRSATYTWNLSNRVDLTNFKPVFQNGILTITLPLIAEPADEEIIGEIE